jgi:RNA polymerase primary sigma factor
MRQFKITERMTPRSSKSIAAYYTEVERYPIITPQEEVELAGRIQEGDKSARDKLATANLRFVISVAKMYGGTGDPEMFNDLISAGNMGLIEAAEKFDPSRGFKFISFAVWHIRKEMLKYLGDNTRMVRIPQNKTNEIRAIMEVTNTLTMKLGREATIEEVMEYVEDTGDIRVKSLSIDRSNIMSVMNADRKPASLDAPFKNDGSNDSTMHDVIASDLSSADSFCVAENMESMTKLLIAGLSPIAKSIVLRRHGIGGGFEESYGSIGHDLGMSSERIRQIYMKSLKIMSIRVRKLKLQKDDIFTN